MREGEVDVGGGGNDGRWGGVVSKERITQSPVSFTGEKSFLLKNEQVEFYGFFSFLERQT